MLSLNLFFVTSCLLQLHYQPAVSGIQIDGGNNGGDGSHPVGSKPGDEDSSGAEREGDIENGKIEDTLLSNFVNLSPNKRPTNDLDDICGTVIEQQWPLNTFNQLTKKREFPWHAALYHILRLNSQYTCGGSLISKYHVITAAHCVTRKDSQSVLNPNAFVVYLAKTNLVSFGAELQERSVSQITLHPQYNPQSYSNDIALVKLRDPVDINEFVRPVCLWQESSDFSSVLNKQGTVVGWGFDETGNMIYNLTQAKMTALPREMCLSSSTKIISRPISNNAYCGSYVNGTTVCSGDAGSGMVFARINSKRNRLVWQLRGLISFSITPGDEFRCDVSNHLVFTDVTKYLEWIKESMTTYIIV